MPDTRVLTDKQVASRSPSDQEKLLDPLRAIAGAVSQAGKSTDADVFSSVKIDAGRDVVDIYVTDAAKAHKLITDAQAINPSLDTSLVRIVTAPYTLVGIQVVNQDITWQECYELYCYNTRGVKGTAASGWAGAAGDSGATVFTVSGTNSRQARGIVTAGIGENPSATIFWTEAPDILNYFGLTLNPQT